MSYVNQYIGKYHVKAQIGRGAMAEVYKAFHPNLNRHVAIKVLHSFLSEKTDILGRFRREAQHVAALQHPNIVTVFDFDAHDAMYYMVMEYIKGPTLKTVLREHRKERRVLDLKEMIKITKDLGNALAYAHGQGVLHRDIKPANVMIDEGFRVVLTDFGLSKIVSGPQFTTTGALVGTPAYMAPEQGLGQPGDVRADIYSLGVLMYQMATGRLPFVADTPLAIVFKHVNAPLPSPQSINRTIPDVVNQIIVRTMEKSPDSRYQSAAELLKDLERVESGELLQSSKPGSESTPPFFPDASKDVAVVSLHVVETGQIITLDEGQEFVLGRVDEGMQNKPEIDLSAFQAFQKGVSRRHALVTLGEKKTVNLTDLNSTNGTWVNGTKIKAQIPMTLHHGDVISLGKLVIQVLVRL